MDEVGHELVAWQATSDNGSQGWMVGRFCTYEGTPFCPMLSPSSFHPNEESARRVLWLQALSKYK